MALRTLRPQPVFNLDRPRRRPAGSGPAPVLAVGRRAGARIGPVKGGKGGVLKDVDMATLGNLCVDIVLNVPRLLPAKREERKACMEPLAASPPDEVGPCFKAFFMFYLKKFLFLHFILIGCEIEGKCEKFAGFC